MISVNKILLKCLFTDTVVNYVHLCPRLSAFFQGSPIQEEKKKRKQQNVILSPQAGI